MYSKSINSPESPESPESSANNLLNVEQLDVEELIEVTIPPYIWNTFSATARDLNFPIMRVNTPSDISTLVSKELRHMHAQACKLEAKGCKLLDLTFQLHFTSEVAGMKISVSNSGNDISFVQQSIDNTFEVKTQRYSVIPTNIPECIKQIAHGEVPKGMPEIMFDSIKEQLDKNPNWGDEACCLKFERRELCLYKLEMDTVLYYEKTPPQITTGSAPLSETSSALEVSELNLTATAPSRRAKSSRLLCSKGIFSSSISVTKPTPEEPELKESSYTP